MVCRGSVWRSCGLIVGLTVASVMSPSTLHARRVVLLFRVLCVVFLLCVCVVAVFGFDFGFCCY